MSFSEAFQSLSQREEFLMALSPNLTRSAENRRGLSWALAVVSRWLGHTFKRLLSLEFRETVFAYHIIALSTFSFHFYGLFHGYDLCPNQTLHTQIQYCVFFLRPSHDHSKPLGTASHTYTEPRHSWTQLTHERYQHNSRTLET